MHIPKRQRIQDFSLFDIIRFDDYYNLNFVTSFCTSVEYVIKLNNINIKDINNVR